MNDQLILAVMYKAEEILPGKYLHFDNLFASLQESFTNLNEEELNQTCLELYKKEYLSIVFKSEKGQKRVVRINGITLDGHEYYKTLLPPSVKQKVKDCVSKLGNSALNLLPTIIELAAKLSIDDIVKQIH